MGLAKRTVVIPFHPLFDTALMENMERVTRQRCHHAFFIFTEFTKADGAFLTLREDGLLILSAKHAFHQYFGLSVVSRATSMFLKEL
jgi:hypothetical protein